MLALLSQTSRVAFSGIATRATCASRSLAASFAATVCRLIEGGGLPLHWQGWRLRKSGIIAISAENNQLFPDRPVNRAKFRYRPASSQVLAARHGAGGMAA
jgi:hypothetical protein